MLPSESQNWLYESRLCSTLSNCSYSLQNKIWNLPDQTTILPKFIYGKKGRLAGPTQVLPVRVRGPAPILKTAPNILLYIFFHPLCWKLDNCSPSLIRTSHLIFLHQVLPLRSNATPAWHLPQCISWDVERSGRNLHLTHPDTAVQPIESPPSLWPTIAEKIQENTFLSTELTNLHHTCIQ